MAHSTSIQYEMVLSAYLYSVCVYVSIFCSSTVLSIHPKVKCNNEYVCYRYNPRLPPTGRFENKTNSKLLYMKQKSICLFFVCVHRASDIHTIHRAVSKSTVGENKHVHCVLPSHLLYYKSTNRIKTLINLKTSVYLTGNVSHSLETSSSRRGLRRTSVPVLKGLLYVLLPRRQQLPALLHCNKLLQRGYTQ